MSLRPRALQVLQIAEPAAKAQAARQLFDDAQAQRLPLDTGARLAEPPGLPGRPARPRLVPPRELPMRAPTTLEGRAALLHAIAHIEFNAINLALDAVWRFADLPEAYYRDWLRVAAEEALHFGLLAEHLATLGADAAQGGGHRYGDFDAHDGLWRMTEATKDDPLARMALVPRTLEARGLDATPPIQAKLRAVGDHRAVAILNLILRDEVGHVAIGNRWYRWLCDQQGLEPIATYRRLARSHRAPPPLKPLNREARLAAGFTPAELED